MSDEIFSYGLLLNYLFNNYKNNLINYILKKFLQYLFLTYTVSIKWVIENLIPAIHVSLKSSRKSIFSLFFFYGILYRNTRGFSFVWQIVTSTEIEVSLECPSDKGRTRKTNRHF